LESKNPTIDLLFGSKMQQSDVPKQVAKASLRLYPEAVRDALNA
jgi:hypothetical protein